MPGCIVSATTASFRSVEKRRLRATPVITSTLENVSDIGTCLGLSLGPPASAGVRSKRGALQGGHIGVPRPLGRQVRHDHVYPVMRYVLFEDHEIVEDGHHWVLGRVQGFLVDRHARRAVVLINPENAPSVLRRLRYYFMILCA